LSQIPTHCPACGTRMNITELKCIQCNTTVQGNFPIDKLISLSKENHDFLITFLRSRGNIKEIQERMGISYPTVKNKLDKLLSSLGLSEEIPNRTEILDALNNGEISAKEAIEWLKSR